MGEAGVSMSGSNGCLRDGTTATLGRICSGPIQTGSFINGNEEDDRGDPRGAVEGLS
jgi:hypothetical protein